MSSPFRRFADIILALRWPICLLFLLSTIFLVMALPALKIDPSIESLFEKKSDDYKFYQEFRKNFGSDSLVAIAIDSPTGYLTYENLRWTRALTTVLSSDARVDRVVSLTNAMDIRHRLIGVKVEPVIAGVLEKQKSFSKFRKEVLSNPFVQGNLLSKDGKTGAILVRLKSKPDNSNFLKGYVGELRYLLKHFPWPNAKFHMAGSPVEQNDFVAAIRLDQMFFIPAVTLLLILSSYLIYRNFPSVIVAMSIVFITLLWTFGTIALLGHSLNLVNSLLAPVVMIISVPNAIYLINLFSELRVHQPSVRECTRLTLQYLGIPCLLTSATVMVGFLSLVFSPVPAVKEFGLFAALGSFYSYVIAMTLTPLLLPILPFKKRVKVTEQRNFFNHVIVTYLEKIDFTLKWWLLFGTLIVMVLSFVGISRIKIDTNLINDLRPDSPIAEATRFIDQKLTGVYALGIAVTRKDGAPLTRREDMEKIDGLAKFLESLPEITKVNSLPMIIKKVHEAREGDPKAFRIPEDEGTLRNYLRRMAKSNNADFQTFISKDFRHARLEARMKAVGTQKGAAVEGRIWDYIHKYMEGYDVKLTGSVVLLGKMSARLVEDQVISVGIAFVIILILISLFFRSWKMGLLASIPNLLPILALYGLMGFLKIDLSTPTAMISSVVLGLVVDASIQFLYRFRHEFDRRHHYVQALHYTYRNVGQAMVVSTLILVFGFASSAFASFRPTVYFGLLTSITIFFALLCTLILLPVALILLKPFGRQPVLAKPSNKF